MLTSAVLMKLICSFPKRLRDSALGNADFGDKRLTKRFVKVARDLAGKPEGSVTQASGSWAGTKGASRFWDTDKVTPEKIRAAHRDKTGERVKE